MVPFCNLFVERPSYLLRMYKTDQRYKYSLDRTWCSSCYSSQWATR